MSFHHEVSARGGAAWGDEFDIRYYLAYRLGTAPDLGLLLDIGCGCGTLMRFAHSTQSIGVDISSESLASAKSLNPHASFIKADFTRMPLREECVDTVVLSWIVDQVSHSQQRCVIMEGERVLRRGGHAYVSDGNCSYSSYRHHPRMPERDWLLRMTTHSLFIKELRGYNLVPSGWLLAPIRFLMTCIRSVALDIAIFRLLLAPAAIVCKSFFILAKKNCGLEME